MAYAKCLDGLYLAVTRSAGKGVDHEGILIAGRSLNGRYIDPVDPIVVHQVPPRIRANRASDVGVWVILGKIEDETAAWRRLQIALRDPQYVLLTNNCQQFARGVAYGRRESPQVQGALLAAGLVGLCVCLKVASEHRSCTRRAA